MMYYFCYVAGRNQALANTMAFPQRASYPLPGLVVAEIELNSADEASAKPKWLEAEVADDARYYNLAAPSRPFAG